jgi:hypothetical protein
MATKSYGRSGRHTSSGKKDKRTRSGAFRSSAQRKASNKRRK